MTYPDWLSIASSKLRPQQLWGSGTLAGVSVTQPGQEPCFPVLPTLSTLGNLVWT